MFVIINVLLSVSLWAQVNISGKAIGAKKKALQGVSISIRNSYDGATTDSSGQFSFTTSEKGNIVLQAELAGYIPFAQPYTIGESDIKLDIVLKESVNELSAVVITAGSFEASDKKKTTVLNPIDIVTTASGNGDITGALKTLPGAQQVGEKEGLFVRGGTSTETKTFIDGSLVNNFFYSSVPNVATRGRFSPFIFKGTIFSTGGYSALYGQALSSALILESIDLPEQTSANVSLTIIGASAGYQHLDKKKRYSFGGNYGYTNLSLAFKLIKQQQEYENVPVYHNADANFRFKTSKTGMIKYYGLFSTNNLKFYTPSIDTLGYLDGFAIKNTNYYHNLSYRESFGKWKFFTGLSFSFNQDNITGGLYNSDKKEVQLPGLEFKNFNQENKSNYFNGKMVFERRLKGLTAVRFGGEYNKLNDQVQYIDYNNQVYNQDINQHISALFAETDIYITNDLAAKIGGRYEYASVLGKSNLAPRVSLAYKLGGEGQASIAYGQFYQNPERQYLPAAVPPGYSKATHYIAQYQRVSKLNTLRAEVFFKKYDNLYKTDFVNGQQIAYSNQGYGDAKGFEFFWRDKKTIKNFDYWLSYSFLDTKRDFLNYPSAIQPSFASMHTASVVLKRFVTQWKTQFNAAYNYNSGRPYYFISPTGNQGEYKFSDRGMSPDYHNVSVSVNFLPSVGKQDAKVFAVYVLSVSNVFGFNQVYNYQYSYNGYRKQAVVPPSKIFVFIGAFISFGIDRSDDVINSNL
jgi:hypothetical protein